VSEVDLGLPALAALSAVSLACGVLMRWVFRKVADQAAIARRRNLIIAHLLEFRLFRDEPGLVLRVQRDIAVESLRLFRLLIGPAVVMTLPFMLLFVQLDGVFGKAPLAPGQPAVVTIGWSDAGEVPRLDATPDIVVESSPVRIAMKQQISWRFRPLRTGRSELRFIRGRDVWTKSVVAGLGLHYFTGLPLPNRAVHWIEVRYAEAAVCGFHWLVWFLLFSSAAFFASARFTI